mmetsp:Transcript_18582/g.43819  ORF Transcript_18582/g.43819 Transcript_18582/m.43819 type:complete len:136 (-) Transcript_18582:379-786(-)
MSGQSSEGGGLVRGHARASRRDARYDPTSACFKRDARQSPFCEVFSPPDFTIGGAGMPYVVINAAMPQQYMSIKQSVDTRALEVYICVSSKITGQVLKARLVEKAHVICREGKFCSIDDVQFFGRYMLKGYKWGM